MDNIDKMINLMWIDIASCKVIYFMINAGLASAHSCICMKWCEHNVFDRD